MSNDNNDNGFELELNNAEQNKAQAKTTSIVDKLKNMELISTLMRISGAVAVVASISLFLLEGWSDGNDLQRYFKLLAQTGLLSFAGLLLSRVIKEHKGAQLFYGLSLGSITANFAILGALIYSVVQIDGELLNYAPSLTWQTNDATLLWQVLVGSMVLLSIISYLGFRLFAHSRAGQLTVTFVALNSLLLIPVRTSLTASLMVLFSFGVASWVMNTLRKNPQLNESTQTKFALATLFLPSVMIVVRALSLYQPDTVFLITMATMVYFIFRTWARYYYLSTIGQYLSGLCISFLTVELFTFNFIGANLLVFTLVACISTLDTVNNYAGKSPKVISYNGGFVRMTVVVIALDGAVFASRHILDLLLSVVCCGAAYGLTLLCAKHVAKPRDIQWLALVAVIVCLARFVYELILLIELNSWMVVGLIGMTLIFGGSLYERFVGNRLDKRNNTSAESD